MPLFQTSPKPKPVDGIAAKIQQRRYQILVHSLIYYELDINLISDTQWSDWAMELVALQRDNPEVANTVIFSEAFKNFDGSTGFDLPYKDEHIVNIARKLIWSAYKSQELVDRLYNIKTTSAENSGTRPKQSDHTPKPKRKAVNKNEPTTRKKLF